MTGRGGRDGAVEGQWEPLFAGGEELVEVPGLRRAWLNGLAGYPASDVLMRFEGVVGELAVVPLPAGLVEAALAHPEPRVRMRLAETQRDLSLDQWARLIAGEPAARWRRRFQWLAFCHGPAVGRARFERWAGDPDPQVRLRALWFRRRPAGMAVALTGDPDPEVRAAITAGLDAYHGYSRVPWVEELHGDAAEMRRLAASASMAVRRTVARAPHLPPDVLERLCRDPDRHVRSTLAACRQDAPAELLIDVAVRKPDAWTPVDHPNFPRHDLLPFADDPDPMRRRLALYATASTAELAERFAAERNEDVRSLAAADPRLSPRTVLRLLDTRPRTREAAIANPRLPVAALVHLLRSPNSARTAACNPAIPPAVQHRMADAALR